MRWIAQPRLIAVGRDRGETDRGAFDVGAKLVERFGVVADRRQGHGVGRGHADGRRTAHHHAADGLDHVLPVGVPALDESGREAGV